MIEQSEAHAISRIVEDFELWRGYRAGYNITIREVADRYYWEIVKGPHTVAGNAISVGCAISAVSEILTAGSSEFIERANPNRRRRTAAAPNLFDAA